MPEAQYLFSTSNLEGGVLQVQNFVGQEAISQLYQFDIDLFSRRGGTVDFDDVLNQTATLTLWRGGEAVPVHGLVAHFEQGGATADYVTYHAVLVPRVWLLTLTHQSRIFQNKTVEEIIEAVLEEYEDVLPQDDVRLDLMEEYPEREYCVQYNETDWGFICRLMEHEGIYFFFEQVEGSDEEPGRERLVIIDDKSKCPEMAGEHTLYYHPETGTVRPDANAEIIQSFVCRGRVVTGKVKLKDYNYRTPDQALLAESQINSEMPGTYYEYGPHYLDQGEGERLARMRNQAIECTRRVMRGHSDCMGFRSGCTFTLGQPGPQEAERDYLPNNLYGDYLITEVAHYGSQGAGLTPGVGGGGYTYKNEFTCIPADVPYRAPRTTPVPRMPGVIVANVEHPDENADDYGHIDEEGRYKARMNFDLRDTEEAARADATLPIRMKQAYSGPRYGIHFPNHHATEMIVACVNGDVDRPMALGTVPNPNQQSPSTSSNKWQSVIRTWGQNELTFDDKQDEENIYMFATKNHTVRVTNNQSISVGSNRTKSVGHDETNTIGNNRTTTVQEGDDTLNVQTGHRTVNVATGHATLNVSTGDRTVNVGTGDYTLNVGSGSRTVNINTNDTVNVQTGDRKVSIVTGNDTLNVAVGDLTISCGAGKITMNAAQEIKLEVGASSITIKPGSIEMKAPMIKSEGTAFHETKSALIKSEATALNILKGGLVQINC